MAYYDPEHDGKAMYIPDELQRLMEEEKLHEIHIQHSEYTPEEADAELIEYKQHFCQTLGQTLLQ